MKVYSYSQALYDQNFNTETFINKAIIIHGDLYSYDMVKYK